MDSKHIMYQTVKALTCFFAEMIQKNRADSNIMTEIHTVLDNWETHWCTIKDWLQVVILTDKKLVLQEFVTTFPELIPYEYMLEQSLDLHDPMWNKVFQNITLCKDLLNKGQ